MTRFSRIRSLRGLTLIELLAALALMSLLIGAIASWLNLAARSGRALAERARFESAAEQALERIFEDLFVGDVDLQSSRRARDSAIAWRKRVIVSDTTMLRIDTRAMSDGRPVIRVYELDRRAQTLVRRETRSGAAGKSAILLGQVREVAFMLDETGEPLERPVLSITIEGEVGRSIQRRYRLP